MNFFLEESMLAFGNQYFHIYIPNLDFPYSTLGKYTDIKLIASWDKLFSHFEF